MKWTICFGVWMVLWGWSGSLWAHNTITGAPRTVCMQQQMPYAYVDAMSDTCGLYVDLVEQIFAGSGLKHQLVLKKRKLEADSIGQYACAVVPQYIQEQLSDGVCLSRVLYSSTSGAMCREDRVVNSVLDLKNGRVAVPDSNYYYKMIRSYNVPIKKDQVMEYSNLKEAIMLLNLKKCDVVLADFRLLVWYKDKEKVKHVVVNEINSMPYLYYFVIAKKQCPYMYDVLKESIQYIRHSGIVDGMFDLYFGNPYQQEYMVVRNHVVLMTGLWLLVVAGLAWVVRKLIRLNRREKRIFREFTDLVMKLPHGVAIYKDGQESPKMWNRQYEVFEQKKKDKEVLFLKEERAHFEYDYEGYSVVLQIDVTQIELAKSQAKRSYRLKKQFLTNMTQDLRKPLNAIVGYASLIVDEEKSKRLKKYSDEVEKHTHVLLHLIDEILDLSQLQADASKNRHPIRYDFGDAVEYLKTQFHDHLNAFHDGKKVELEITSNFKSLMSNADPARVMKVLSNLVSHAFENTKQGKVSVDFHFRQDIELVTIRIMDTGMGISKEDLEMLFESPSDYTFKMSSSYVLAFNISKLIVEYVGGNMQVTSTEGEGTTVTITSKNNVAVRYSLVE